MPDAYIADCKGALSVRVMRKVTTFPVQPDKIRTERPKMDIQCSPYLSLYLTTLYMCTELCKLLLGSWLGFEGQLRQQNNVKVVKKVL